MLLIYTKKKSLIAYEGMGMRLFPVQIWMAIKCGTNNYAWYMYTSLHYACMSIKKWTLNVPSQKCVKSNHSTLVYRLPGGCDKWLGFNISADECVGVAIPWPQHEDNGPEEARDYPP